MSYPVLTITPEERERLADQHAGRTPFQRKSDIYGCCVKLLTDRDLSDGILPQVAGARGCAHGQHRPAPHGDAARDPGGR